MILGKVLERMCGLRKGQAIVVTVEDVRDSASYNLDSGFDIVRKEDMSHIVDEVNGKQYPNYTMSEQPLDGTWILHKD